MPDLGDVVEAKHWLCHDVARKNIVEAISRAFAPVIAVRTSLSLCLSKPCIGSRLASCRSHSGTASISLVVEAISVAEDDAFVMPFVQIYQLSKPSA
jgi:hypothetical protein